MTSSSSYARKRLFAQHVLSYVPLAAHIKHVLDERAAHRAPASRFRDELEDHMSEAAAEQTLRTIISWAAMPKRSLMTRVVVFSAGRTQPDAECPLALCGRLVRV
jgi:hypothetical protein